jgi:UDP-N-acetylglucosamine 2-epimerase (non-hydrolysing)
MVVVGTRPDAIKLAPVIRSIDAHPLLEAVVVATGQHREMLDQVLGPFGIVPDVDLAVMQDGQSLDEVTARVLGGMSDVIRARRPEVVAVQGDTATAMAAALAAFYARVPVVHVEAGLRSQDVGSPFPEEANRRLVGVLTSLHLAPTGRAQENLVREGVPVDRVVVTGNTVIDALLWATEHEIPLAASDPDMLDGVVGPVVLVTAHRRESWGPPLRRVGLAVAAVARAEPQAQFVLPLHRNPIVGAWLLPPLRELPNVHVTEPLTYTSLCCLLRRSHLVVTDSGGLQEEAPALGKPVLVLRDQTERPEGLEAGTARLVGTHTEHVRDAILELLRNDDAYNRMANVANPYGDGHAADRAAVAIAHLLELGPPPAPFIPPVIEEQAPTPVTEAVARPQGAGS